MNRTRKEKQHSMLLLCGQTCAKLDPSGRSAEFIFRRYADNLLFCDYCDSCIIIYLLSCQANFIMDTDQDVLNFLGYLDYADTLRVKVVCSAMHNRVCGYQEFMFPSPGFAFPVTGSNTSSFQRDFLDSIPLAALDKVFPLLASTSGFYRNLPPLFDRILAAELVQIRPEVMISVAGRDLVSFLRHLWTAPKFVGMMHGEKTSVVHTMLDYAVVFSAPRVVKYILDFDDVVAEPSCFNVYEALAGGNLQLINHLIDYLIMKNTIMDVLSEYPSGEVVVSIFKQNSPAVVDAFCRCMLQLVGHLDLPDVMAYFYLCPPSVANQIMAILFAYQHIHPSARHPYNWTLMSIRHFHRNLEVIGAPSPWSSLVVRLIHFLY
jgi:hypothetical protein